MEENHTQENPYFHERDFCSCEDIDYSYLLSLNGFQTGNAITLEELLAKHREYILTQLTDINVAQSTKSKS
jgi:hypothetical protein